MALRPEDVPLGIGVKVDKAIVQAVEYQTRGQMENSDWLDWCRYRIGASMAHGISHSGFAKGEDSNPRNDHVQMILGNGPDLGHMPAIRWGIDHEAQAVQKYEELKRELGGPVTVEPCGLFIDPQHSWLAAIPDGIVNDETTGDRLCLEVKCPYKHKDNTVREACLDRNFCLELGDVDQEYQLKTDHEYYTQVQCQMAVTGIHKADLAVFTLRETVVVPVTFDPVFWNGTVAKLETFYRGILELLPQRISNA